MKNEKSNIKYFPYLIIILLIVYFVIVVIGAFEKTRIASTIDITATDNINEFQILQESRSVILNVIGYLQAALAWIAAVFALIWSIVQYQQEKEKDRRQQESLDKQRREQQELLAAQERKLEEQKNREDLLRDIHSSLADIWAGVSSEKESDRSASIARLLFLIEMSSRDVMDDAIRIQIASALAHAGRQKNTKQTIETITPVVVKAFNTFDHNIISKVSWQGLHLIKADFSVNQRERNFSGLNFREAVLEDANFSNCNLSNADFEQARLNGTMFNECKLIDANLKFSDLAGVSFANSDLKKADLRRTLLENVNFIGANLYEAKLSEYIEVWRLTRNWRSAKNLRTRFKNSLESVYGAVKNENLKGRTILMIAWEFPPIVSGGGWTALYHLIFNLIREGWRILLVIPWPKEQIDFTVFGNEVDIISVFEKDTSPLSVYASVYGGIYSAISAQLYKPNLDFEATKQREIGHRKKTTIVGVSERFAENVSQQMEAIYDKYSPTIIYTHDWLCARAGQLAKEIIENNNKQAKWIAQFHSLESDRQERNVRSHMIETIERDCAKNADIVVAVSERTAKKIADEYQREDVTVLPNYLSNIDDLDHRYLKNVGDYDSKNVVFLGRFSWQKGPDIFVRVAEHVQKIKPKNIRPHFMMYGEGPMEREVGELINGLFPQEPYNIKPIGTTSFATLNKEFGAIEPVLFGEDFTSKILQIAERFGELSNEHAKIIEKTLYERGFFAYRIQGERPYTHLVRMANTEGGWHSDYLVEAARLPPPKYLNGRPVELMGVLPWNNRYDAYDGSSVIVVPSRNEPYGLVIAEAILWGVPVIYTREAGISELLDNPIGAISIADPELIAAEICKLLSDFEYWESFLDRQKEQLINIKADNKMKGFINTLEQIVKPAAQKDVVRK